MAYYIDYDKCYNGLDIDNGNSNKKTSVSIDIKTITQNEEQTTSVQRNIVTKSFLGHSFNTESYFDAYNIKHDIVWTDIEFYHTILNITLPFSEYEDLANATDITLNGMQFNGNYKAMTNLIFPDYIYLSGVDYNTPFFSNSQYEASADETATISYEEADNDENNIKSYSTVIEEIDNSKNFSPTNGILDFCSNYPIFTFKKYDSYILLTIDFISRIVYLYPYGNLVGTEFGYQFNYYDYTLANITISYTSITAESSNETTIYGDTENTNYRYETDSFLFATGNTIYGGLDYNAFYANELLNNYQDGKQILKITIPVGAFSPNEIDKDILEEDDECYLVRKVDEEYKSIYTDSSGNPQLYRVCYSNFNYSSFSRQEIHLEPIYSQLDTDIYEVSENTVNGLKEDVSIPTILNIPYIIDGNIITQIGDNAFEYNFGIEKIILPFTLISIGDYSFSGISSIKTSIEFNSGLQNIGTQAFHSSTIRGDLTIPEGVINIGFQAFYNCTGLIGTLTIPSTFKFPTSSERFKGCSNLSRIIVYSDDIQSSSNLTDFDDTGDCPIYVLDSLKDLFKTKCPNVNSDRFVSLSTLDT